MNIEAAKKIDDGDSFNKDNTKLDNNDFKPILKVVKDNETENISAEEKIEEIKKQIISDSKEKNARPSYDSSTKEQRRAVFNSPINKEVFSKIDEKTSFFKKVLNYFSKERKEDSLYEKGKKYLNERNDGGKIKQEVKELMKTDPKKAQKWIKAFGKGWKQFTYNPDTEEFERSDSKGFAPKETHW